VLDLGELDVLMMTPFSQVDVVAVVGHTPRVPMQRRMKTNSY
jgi:hypothetical protein